MFRSFRIGRLLGFPIDVHASFLALLAIVALWMGGLAGVFTVLVAFASVVLHELGHAVVARKLGVNVSGIELYFFGGAAKLTEQPKTARDEIAIAAAGPAVSFALALFGLLLSALIGGWFLSLFAAINLVIGAFNLIPALPMDGGRILRAALSYRFGFVRATEYAHKVSRVVAVAFGVVGLATGQFQLAILAVVLWLMGNAEMRAAHVSGYRRGQQSRGMPQPASQVFGNDFWDLPPRAPRRTTHHSRITIRREGGRLIIEGL